jgi:predicted alpha/beta superfamily hydrolase
MGALISTYGAAKYPSVFGKAGAFSPAYWFSSSNLATFLQTNSNDISHLKVFHLVGEKESATMVNMMEMVNGKMLGKGMQKSNSKVKIDADGTHSEGYWKREFEGAYKWLFAKE